MKELLGSEPICTYENEKITTPVGFEPTRAKPNGLAGRRLNHSAKVSFHIFNRRGYFNFVNYEEEAMAQR